MGYRERKRVRIGIVFACLIALLMGGVFLLFRAPATCLDGKQNQHEAGIDCGGPCAACLIEPVLDEIRVTETAIVPGGTSSIYDVMGEISNPNNDSGASLFHYIFRLKNSSGEIVAERQGRNFILPGQTKYLVELGLSTSDVPTTLELILSDVDWEKFSAYREQPNIQVYDRQFNLSTSSVGYAEVKGLVENRSPFDFTIVDLSFVLRDASDRIIALHRTDMRTLSAGSKRDFRVFWPDPFPGEVRKIEVQADANVYRSDTFVRQYLPEASGTFQDLER